MSDKPWQITLAERGRTCPFARLVNRVVKRGRGARTEGAVLAGRAAGSLSRMTGRGAGGMVGGRVALKVDPDLLKELSKTHKTVLVTGTNGKSTTTRFTAQALATKGDVAANLGGDNMTNGIVAALLSDPKAQYAVLEVDEMHLPSIVRETDPDAIILLNLSRDQLDRVGEIGAVEARLREAVGLAPNALVVANCDDPLVTSAAWDAKKVQWVAAGAAWSQDSTTFPRTGTLVGRDGDQWRVEDSDDYQRPTPDWYVEPAEGQGAGEHPAGEHPAEEQSAEEQSAEEGSGTGSSFRLHGPDGRDLLIHLQLPGRANWGNAAQAAAVAAHFGVTDPDLVRALGAVGGVAGRYQTYDVSGRKARLLLAKNPAGWQEALTMIPAGTRQIVTAVNGQPPDGEDLSWLWDVDFENIRDIAPQRVIAAGERAADLAVRLEYAGIECSVIPNPREAIEAMAPGDVQVLANYTAFRDLKKEIERP